MVVLHTYGGSSGSPVLKVVDRKLRVVAVHHACQKISQLWDQIFCNTKSCYPNRYMSLTVVTSYN